jgi:lysophospholipase L1-like esterase
MKMTSSMLLRALLFCALLAPALRAAEGNTAIQPAPQPGASWMNRHQSFVEITKQGGVDVLFLGDSITDFWRNRGKAVWDTNYASLKAENFGISADRTQHVLWRIANGELDGIKPKALVLMIGTNNTGKERNSDRMRNTTPEAIEGVTAVVKAIRAKLPETKILLLGIFPRADNDVSPPQIKDINAAIARLDDGKFIKFLDIGAKFLAPDGTLTREIMPDLLHPSEKGYQIWAEAIKEPLAGLMK